MRRIITLVVCMSLLIGVLNACDKSSSQPESILSNDSDVKEIVVTTYYDYVKVAMDEFIRLHPDFPYKIRVKQYVSVSGLVDDISDLRRLG